MSTVLLTSPTKSRLCENSRISITWLTPNKSEISRSSPVPLQLSRLCLINTIRLLLSCGPSPHHQRSGSSTRTTSGFGLALASNGFHYKRSPSHQPLLPSRECLLFKKMTLLNRQVLYLKVPQRGCCKMEMLIETTQTLSGLFGYPWLQLGGSHASASSSWLNF